MIWFKKKDPICGMKQKRNNGIEESGQWFCSQNCLGEYKTLLKKQSKKRSCC